MKPSECRDLVCYPSCKYYRSTDVYPYYECTYFSDESYTDLYSGSKRLILQAGTRSGVVEEFARFLSSAFPKFRCELKDAVPLEDGWYLIRVMKVPNLDSGIEKITYFVRKLKDGKWEFNQEV